MFDNRCFSEPPHDTSSELQNLQNGRKPQYSADIIPAANPLQNAIYAQVNKSSKSQQKPVMLDSDNSKPNYANLDFANSLELYENGKDVLSRVAQLQGNIKSPKRNFSEPRGSPVSFPGVIPSNTQAHNGHNYINMSPKHNDSKKQTSESQSADYTAMCLPGLPALPPEPEYTQMIRDDSGQNVLSVHHQQLTESVESMAIMCDNKFNTIKQMPKNTKTETFNLGKFSILHHVDILYFKVACVQLQLLFVSVYFQMSEFK